MMEIYSDVNQVCRTRKLQTYSHVSVHHRWVTSCRPYQHYIMLRLISVLFAFSLSIFWSFSYSWNYNALMLEKLHKSRLAFVSYLTCSWAPVGHTRYCFPAWFFDVWRWAWRRVQQHWPSRRASRPTSASRPPCPWCTSNLSEILRGRSKHW